MRSLGRLFPPIVLLAGAAIYWGKVAQRGATGPAPPDRKPTVVGLPPVRVQPGTAPSDDPHDEASVRARMEAILQRVVALSDRDEKGLQELNDRMRDIVRWREADFVAFFREQLPLFETMPLKRSYFLVGTLLDSAPDESNAVKELLTLERKVGVRGERRRGPSNLGLVKSFALQRMVDQPGARGRYRELLPVLIDLAKHDKDLTLAREALIAITRLGIARDPGAVKQEVLRARRAEERRAFRNI